MTVLLRSNSLHGLRMYLGSTTRLGLNRLLTIFESSLSIVIIFQIEFRKRSFQSIVAIEKISIK